MQKILLFIIVCVAAFLRFYAIDTNPPSLTWDEAAWGYNAYTLGIDGKDEFGRFLPFDYLESFGDFKPPVYAYLSIVPIKMFGLTELGVRFSSAFFGTLTVLLAYYLTRQLFSQKSEKLALLAAGILAVSPWHILLSRAAFEANVATFFIVCGLWLFFVALSHKKYAWLLTVSVMSFVLAIQTFNSARVVVPLLGIVLLIGFYRQLLKVKKQALLAGIVGLFFMMPLIPFLLSPQAQLRFKEVNIFSDVSIVERANQQIANDNSVWWSKIIHNRRLAYGVAFFNHYFDNLNPQFLFIKGDGNPKFSTQTVGQMYLWELPFLVLGSLLLWKKREGHWWMIPIWLFLSIIPAATARETPHALRIEAGLPTYQILVAYGIFQAFSFVKQKKTRNIFALLLTVIFIFSLGYFLHGYYKHYPSEYSREWQYGYKESIQFVNTVSHKYDHIYVTDNLGRPYAYYLFYMKTPPEIFRKTAKIRRDPLGFVDIDGFDKYTFVKNFQAVPKNDNSLYISTIGDVPKNAQILKNFSLVNGEVILAAYTL